MYLLRVLFPSILPTVLCDRSRPERTQPRRVIFTSIVDAYVIPDLDQLVLFFTWP